MTSSSHDPKSQVTELLADFLAASHADESAEFEALCAAHPQEAAKLRHRYARNRELNKHLAVFRALRGADKKSNDSDGARAGDVIGDFRLDSRLASGGQGEVWEATQTSLSRKVALKLVLPDRINEKTLALFAREARAGGRLSHPGIVAVHGYGEDDGRHWISQELVEGSWTLRDFIDDMRKAEELPEDYYPAAAVFLAELADALQAAHDAGIIHRDVKPQNILVTPNDHPKLTDFGLARITDEVAMSLTGDFAGTWLYMSPEQVTAKRVEIDHRTDIFSLGVVMYEMLALVRPFDGDTTHQIAESIVMRDPPDLRKIRSRVPRDLAVICGKALEKAKDARFQSMAEFAADLRRHLAHEPIHAQPPTLLDRGVKWVRRHPTKSLVSSIATVALIAISTLAVMIADQNEQRRLNQSALSQSNLETTAANEALNRRTEEVLVNTEAARASAAEAQENLLEAKRRTEEILRLSLSKDYDDLIAEADSLWPARPDKISALEGWRIKGEALLAELPGLKESLDALQATTADGEPAEVRSRWWQNQLTGLIEKLESLAAEGTGLMSANGVSVEHGWSVARRLASAERLAAGFAAGGEFLERWEAASAALAATYPGLDLPVQMGLVPLGPDPTSKLWEFWHVESGTEPLRDEAGVLELEESSGLVLVLLPGGKFWMGATTDRAAAHNFDAGAQSEESPVHEVELSAFFLSKYEMTQGQWKRLAGANPSIYGPDGRYSTDWNAQGLKATLLEPVEQVSYFACVSLLDRVGLALPSEAQWEYGCRAGTSSVYWSGDTKESLQGAANLSDAYAKEHAGGGWSGWDLWLKDGNTSHAPVNTLRANDFGLHHVHGNVREWCLDEYDGGFYEREQGVDPLNFPTASGLRVLRGGSYYVASSLARSASRFYSSPRAEAGDLGLWHRVGAVRRACVPGTDIEAAAPGDTDGGRRRKVQGVYTQRAFIETSVVLVQAPLPHIPMHVVQPKVVRPQGVHRRMGRVAVIEPEFPLGPSATPILLRIRVGQVGRALQALLRVSAPVHRGSSCATPVLPLSFARQNEAHAIQQRNASEPRHLFHGFQERERQTLRVPARVVPTIRPIAARVHARKTFPLTLRHLVLRQEVRGEFHLVHRGFVALRAFVVVGPVGVLRLSAHPELATGQQYEHEP